MYIYCPADGLYAFNATSEGSATDYKKYVLCSTVWVQISMHRPAVWQKRKSSQYLPFGNGTYPQYQGNTRMGQQMQAAIIISLA